MSRSESSKILNKLRVVMKDKKYVSQTLQAYIILSEDRHQSEYTGKSDKRRDYVSGFTGSKGTAIITEQKAALWVDGRYELQASTEVDDNWIIMKQNSKETPSESKWLCDVLLSGSRVGFDPHIMPFNNWKTFHKKFASSQLSFVPVKENLVDIIWEDRPDCSKNAVDCLSIEYTGKSCQEKIETVRKKMEKENASSLVITELDEIAWLFNLRGSDINYNPVFYSYAIITMEAILFFIDDDKLTSEAKKYLENEMNILIYPYKSIYDVLEEIVREKQQKVWISGSSSFALVSIIPEDSRLLQLTPIAIEKALKTENEIEGARTAHISDAVALCEFFEWLQRLVPHEDITEITAAEYLDNLRKSQKNCMGISFATISAFGSNSAVIHYKPADQTNKRITCESVYLVDSGGQYRDGTTDVTRTVHFGTPSEYQKKCYTLVLKGVIALSTAIFPKYTTGHRLDSFARQFLWKEGFDYKHGTGHGVGAFLNVHEGPMSISFLVNSNDPGLQPGMILSIEPGYYEDNNFGIRIENLVATKKSNTPHNFQNIDYLEFEQLTLVPLDLKLIEKSLLVPEEVAWINNYHSLCREVIGKVLLEQEKTEVFKWLMNATVSL